MDQDQRISQIMELIQRLAAGQLDARGEPTDAADELDAVIVGLNMLAEEFSASTVSIEQYETKVRELQAALDDVQTLTGLLPICAWCKSVRDDSGYWSQIEEYIADPTGARFSHGMCPDCAERNYPGHSTQEA